MELYLYNLKATACGDGGVRIIAAHGPDTTVSFNLTCGQTAEIVGAALGFDRRNIGVMLGLDNRRQGHNPGHSSDGSPAGDGA